jgi:Cu(I)/Ag(I) efflux system membrane fusion protein
MKRSNWIVVGIAIFLSLILGWLVGRSSDSNTPQKLSAVVKDTSPKILYYRNPMGLADTSPVPKQDSMGMDYIPVYETVDNTQPKKILYYRNPMGLSDTSPVPKKDSMGMDYIPVYEEESGSVEPGTVIISPEKIQKLGVRTELVKLMSLSSNVRASATIQIDETKQYAIAPKYEGWVEKLYANQTGMLVQRGQPLMIVYSPEVLAAQDEYRIADNAARQLQASDPNNAASMRRLRDASQARLGNWDINTTQLSKIGQNKVSGNLTITSPVNAVVVDKPIVQGARFGAGEVILRLADLSNVWAIADVPASSANGIAIGQFATFQSSTLPGKTFKGQVTFIQPIIDSQTRTLAVRIELPNTNGILRPGLFGDINLTQDASAAVLTVPRSAVLDSGTRQTVLVQVVEGKFEPRPVILGKRSGEYVEILQGVSEGERVVVSANFLIDAESNLQSALNGLNAQQSAEDIPMSTSSPTESSTKSVDHSNHDQDSKEN